MHETVATGVAFVALGGFAGWLAGLLLKGRGHGLIANILIGVLGAVIGAWAFQELGLSFEGVPGLFLMAFAGAVPLVFVTGVLGKAVR